ncbi:MULTISPECIES: anti-sigma-F factor Fin [Tepidibacillus]|nr:hypothetical protein HK1_01428 [Tepidibacillus sp. HK-1]
MIQYVCKHCGQHLGSIDDRMFSEEELGLHSLTPSEREGIITYEQNGDKTVQVICEYCQEALELHPELLLISNPLQ